MVPSDSTNLRSRVRIPSTPFKFFLICIAKIETVIDVGMRKGRKLTKRGHDWPIFKNPLVFFLETYIQ